MFYDSRQLSYLFRFHLRPLNPTLPLIGVKQSFYTKSGHHFRCLRNSSNIYFLESRNFDDQFFLLRRIRPKPVERCFSPIGFLSCGTHSDFLYKEEFIPSSPFFLRLSLESIESSSPRLFLLLASLPPNLSQTYC